MINRIEKTMLSVLAGLGAGYWGYGLILYLSIPGEYKPWFGLEMGLGSGVFLIYGAAIFKNKIRRRTTAWALFVAVLLISVGLVFLIEAVFQPRSEGA